MLAVLLQGLGRGDRDQPDAQGDQGNSDPMQPVDALVEIYGPDDRRKNIRECRHRKHIAEVSPTEQCQARDQPRDHEDHADRNPGVSKGIDIGEGRPTGDDANIPQSAGEAIAAEDIARNYYDADGRSLPDEAQFFKLLRSLWM